MVPSSTNRPLVLITTTCSGRYEPSPSTCRRVSPILLCPCPIQTLQEVFLYPSIWSTPAGILCKAATTEPRFHSSCSPNTPGMPALLSLATADNLEVLKCPILSPDRLPSRPLPDAFLRAGFLKTLLPSPAPALLPRQSSSLPPLFAT